MDKGAALQLSMGPNLKSATLEARGRQRGPVKLCNRAFLPVWMSLFLETTDEGERLKVKEASFQYQLDLEGKQWVWRYDYVRESSGRHPAGHLQVNAVPVEKVSLPRKVLANAHFPTGRVSLEAMIRLLIDGFGVRPNQDREVWEPVLLESEGLFLEVAHIPTGATTNAEQSW